MTSARGPSPPSETTERPRNDCDSPREPRAAAHAELLTTTAFAGIGGAALDELRRLFGGRRLAAGELVFLEGAPGDQLFMVAEGRLRAFRHVPPACELTVFTLSRGDLFGLLPLLDCGPYPVSVAALTAAEVLVLHRNDFLRFTREHPPFCLALLAYLARRLRDSFERIETLCRQGAVARAAHALLGLIPPGVQSDDDLVVTLPCAQAELARLLHVTEANLSRALTRLRSQGVLRAAGPHRFRIADLEALHRAADGK